MKCNLCYPKKWIRIKGEKPLEIVDEKPSRYDDDKDLRWKEFPERDSFVDIEQLVDHVINNHPTYVKYAVLKGLVGYDRGASF